LYTKIFSEFQVGANRNFCFCSEEGEDASRFGTGSISFWRERLEGGWRGKEGGEGRRAKGGGRKEKGEGRREGGRREKGEGRREKEKGEGGRREDKKILTANRKNFTGTLQQGSQGPPQQLVVLEAQPGYEFGDRNIENSELREQEADGGLKGAHFVVDGLFL
jgi:hypothetical protein